VTQIITYGTMLAKGVIRDVGRVLDIPYAEVDRVAKLVPNTLGITLEKAMEQEPKLRELKKDARMAELIEIALNLEGQVRHASNMARIPRAACRVSSLFKTPRTRSPPVRHEGRGRSVQVRFLGCAPHCDPQGC
jgi:hypothetical protein